MKTSKIYSYWLVLLIICSTLWNSTKILCKTFFSFHGRSCSSKDEGYNNRKYVDKIAIRWSKRILQILKVTYKIVNSSDVKLERNQPYIIMSNHASHFDIPLVFVSFPHNSVRMVAKKELFKVPIWGHCLRYSEFISIDRNNRKQAALDLKIARQRMETGIIPWVAPEGTRSKDGNLQSFKKGGFMLALQTGATIIPVGIRGSHKILPAKTLNFSVGENVEIHIGKPIKTNEYTVKDMSRLMQDVEASIKQLCTGELSS